MQDELISIQAVVGYLCAHCPDDAECFEDCDDIKNIKALSSVNPQNCDTCEVGNPCIYCKHEFEPQEREDKE